MKKRLVAGKGLGQDGREKFGLRFAFAKGKLKWK